MPLEFNQRAAIAAELQILSKDLDIPVNIDGDVWNGAKSGYDDMDEGEAARIVVDAVLDHPYVAAAMEEREVYWEALKWLTLEFHNGPGIPLDLPVKFHSTFTAALEAALFGSNE